MSQEPVLCSKYKIKLFWREFIFRPDYNNSPYTGGVRKSKTGNNKNRKHSRSLYVLQVRTLSYELWTFISKEKVNPSGSIQMDYRNVPLFCLFCSHGIFSKPIKRHDCQFTFLTHQYKLKKKTLCRITSKKCPSSSDCPSRKVQFKNWEIEENSVKSVVCMWLGENLGVTVYTRKKVAGVIKVSAKLDEMRHT